MCMSICACVFDKLQSECENNSMVKNEETISLVKLQEVVMRKEKKEIESSKNVNSGWIKNLNIRSKIC